MFLTAAATHGLGQNVSLTPGDQSRALLFVNIAQSILNLASITVKLSIAVFLYRLVSSNRPRKIAIIVPAVLLTLILLAAMAILWFSCTPLRYGWDWYVVGGHCDDSLQLIAVLTGGIAILVTEIFYASFAWFLIRGLQMPKTEKIVIGACMSIGYL